MYHGPAAEALGAMKKLGYYNPAGNVGTAEFLLKLVSVDMDDTDGSKARIDRIAEASRATSSKTKGAHASLIKRLPRLKMMQGKIGRNFRPAASFITQTRLLIKRNFKEIIRGRGALIIQCITQIMTAGIYGVLYKLKDNTSSVFDRYGLLSLVAIGTLNLGMASSIRSFPKEKELIKDEQDQNLFSTIPYFIAKALSEIPFTAGLSCLFGGIVYPLCGLSNTKDKFRNFLGLISVHSVTAKSLGLLVSALSPSSESALALFAPLVVLQIVFDGKNLSYENTPQYLKFMQHLSLVRLAWQGLCLNEFKGLTFSAGARGKGGKRIATGQDALDQFDIGGTIPDVILKQVRILAACWGGAILTLILGSDNYAQMTDDDDDGGGGNGSDADKNKKK